MGVGREVLRKIVGKQSATIPTQCALEPMEHHRIVSPSLVGWNQAPPPNLAEI